MMMMMMMTMMTPMVASSISSSRSRSRSSRSSPSSRSSRSSRGCGCCFAAVAWGLMLTSTLWARRSLQCGRSSHWQQVNCGGGRRKHHVFWFAVMSRWHVLLDWRVLICVGLSLFTCCLNMYGTCFLAPFPFLPWNMLFESQTVCKSCSRFELCTLLLLGYSLIITCRESQSTFTSQATGTTDCRRWRTCGWCQPRGFAVEFLSGAYMSFITFS